ncbi:RHS repeat-associated core domain-containing protein [Chryseobacterium sp. Hurlbut01]|uniref:RHS repeat-associated core domain-containing protein n=1 Tax=Chryseobacterium sp. Hurlbut01 TaxID=1681828 RepID=UPI00067B4C54|nr:RHS repeat-associated core domain-containing protein [Chryseobacterium sp. Hurlbut01]KNB61719.1 hypothetical protein AC804_10445 [Chryseobacterium sp. Hurlbut01]
MKKLFGTVETHYVDGFQYKTVGSEVKLVIIPTSGGYYDAQRDAYFYNFTDHLGNVRLSYSDADGNGVVTGDVVVEECSGGNCSSYIIPGEIEAISNYYPFGMLLENHNNQANSSNVYKYKYNGKELQESGMYDYGARFYMPDLGRWGVVDPLAEISRRFSPYVYGNNNPIRFIDPDGMAAQDTFEAGVEYTGQAAIDMFNAISSFYGYSNSSNNGFPSFNFSYIDPGGAAGTGGGSSLSGWMQSYLSSPPDDHFNQFGQYLYTDNKATNNIVIDFQNPITGAINTAPWLSKLLSDYKFDKSNYSVLTNIANYYATQAGVNMNNLKNGSTSLGIANYHFESGKMVGKVYSFNGGKFKPDALMSGNFETQVISIMVGNGSVSELLNDKYNMISSLGHEGGTVSHLTLNPKTWIDGVKAHIKIYEYQMQSQVYKFTTPLYKQKMRDNLIGEQYNYKTYGPTK